MTERIKIELHKIFRVVNTDFIQAKVDDKGIEFSVNNKYLKLKELIGEEVKGGKLNPVKVISSREIQEIETRKCRVNFDVDGICLPFLDRCLDLELFKQELSQGKKPRTLGVLESHIKFIMDELNNQAFSSVAVLGFTKFLAKKFKAEYGLFYIYNSNNEVSYKGALYLGSREVNIEHNTYACLSSYGHVITTPMMPEFVIHNYKCYRCNINHMIIGVGLVLGAEQFITAARGIQGELVSVKALCSPAGETLAYRLRTVGNKYDISVSVFNMISEEAKEHLTFEGYAILQMRGKIWGTSSEFKSGVFVKDISNNKTKALKYLRNVGIKY